MYDFISPNSVSGLNLWFDASDLTTINDGKVSNNNNVYKFVDKVSGVVLRNGSGANGPIYKMRSIKDRHSILFDWYTTTLDNGLKGLTGSNITQLNSATSSLFVVFKPTTKIHQSGSIGNQSYVVSIWDQTSIDVNSRRGLPIRSISLGDEGSATIDQKTSGAVRFTEAVPTASNLFATGYVNTNTFMEHFYTRSLEGSSNLGYVCLTSARLMNGPKKIAFISENNQCLEDATIGVSEGVGKFKSLQLISGTFAQITNSNLTINGSSSQFTKDLFVGDDIYNVTVTSGISNSFFLGRVKTISSDTVLDLETTAKNLASLGKGDKMQVAVDFGSGAGTPKLPSPFNGNRSYYKMRNFRITGSASSPGPRPLLVIGAYWPYTIPFNTTEGGYYPFEGHFCELLNYDRYLSDEETNSIREYLKMKWFTENPL